MDRGEVVLAKGYGRADKDRPRPNDANTVFRIGSLSKQFTAAAILALAHDGKLALRDPLTRFFPEYPRENLSKDGVEVTLHHLLCHTSGLADARKTEYFKSRVWRRPIDRDALVARSSSLPLVRTPGTKFEYLNYGYFLLGVVIERVSGRSYDDFLRNRLLAPLGMTSSGTVLPEELSGRAAIGYHRSTSGSLTSMALDPEFGDRDLTMSLGSGQIYSTVTDLARWEGALAGGRVQGQAQLFQPNLEGYGYGWVIEEANGAQHFWHNGALSPLGFSSFMIRIPSKKRMIAYLSNLDVALTEELEAKVAKLGLE
ncbi:MAG: beta-lactamase family protein [Labilithrix sp.]|nr:beta-lactamase family protein [Labilithrix sp.]